MRNIPKSPFDLLLDQIRQVVREEIAAAKDHAPTELLEAEELAERLKVPVSWVYKKTLGEFEGGNGEYIEIEPPLPEGEYATGADWGVRKDWTVIVTIRYDIRPARIVAFQRFQRRPVTDLFNRLDARLDRYPGNGCHDGTGMDIIGGLLKNDAESFKFTGQNRSELITKWICAIEAMDVEAPLIKTAYSEHKFMSNEVFSTGEKQEHLPDTVAACALAWHARNQSRVSVL